MGCPFLWACRAIGDLLYCLAALAFLPLHVLAYGFRPGPGAAGRNPQPRAPRRDL
jgi:hypothetical protein